MFRMLSQRRPVLVQGDVGRVGAEEDDEIVGPLLEQVPVFGRHAQHLDDDGGRQGKSQVVDQVHAPGALDRVQETVHQLLDVRSHGLDHVRREGLADQPAQPRVLRRVGENHPLGEEGEERLQLLAAGHLLKERGPIRGQPQVVQPGRDLIVVRTRLPSFIVTLASLFILRGLSIAITRAVTGRTQIPYILEICRTRRPPPSSTGTFSPVFSGGWGVWAGSRPGATARPSWQVCRW